MAPSSRSARIREDVALTFDDVLLAPRHSLTHPREVSLISRFTRGISLNVPLVSAAMDTVTESEMAIAMARYGAIGVLHKNMSIDRQAAEVDRVKRSESGMILNPITLSPTALLREAVALMMRFKISGVPIVDASGTLVGVTNAKGVTLKQPLSCGAAHTAIVSASGSLLTMGLNQHGQCGRLIAKSAADEAAEARGEKPK